MSTANEPALNLSAITEADLASIAAITREAGVDLDDCYQCGKCSAGCPMSHAMDLRPRQVIRALQMGQYQKAVNAKSPWICAVCMACSARCPQEIDIHGLMLAIRRTAKRSGLRPLREADVFDDCFVANIRTWGKSNEAILAAKYNVASGHLAQDALNAPRMAVRKMIGLKIHKVKDRAAVRSLVDRVLKREG